MSVQPGTRAKHLTAFLFGLGLLLALTLILADQTATPTSGTGHDPEEEHVPEMRLVIVEPADACVGGQCQVDTNQTFTLGVEIINGPDDGYILAQSSVFYGGNITYDLSPAVVDEIVWPDCNSITALKRQIDRRLPSQGENNTTEMVSHGCLTGLLPPQPVSTFVGRYLEIVMVCSPQDSANQIDLLPYVFGSRPDIIAGTSGSGFISPSNPVFFIVPKLVGLNLFCGTPPTPTQGPTITPGGPSPTPTPTPDLSTPTPSPTATFVSDLPCGDVNGDRRVNAEDALWLLWFSTDMIPSLPNPGDVNGDGVVDPLDALFVLWIELNLFRCL